MKYLVIFYDVDYFLDLDEIEDISKVTHHCKIEQTIIDTSDIDEDRDEDEDENEIFIKKSEISINRLKFSPFPESYSELSELGKEYFKTQSKFLLDKDRLRDWKYVKKLLIANHLDSLLDEYLKLSVEDGNLIAIVKAIICELQLYNKIPESIPERGIRICRNEWAKMASNKVYKFEESDPWRSYYPVSLYTKVLEDNCKTFTQDKLHIIGDYNTSEGKYCKVVGDGTIGCGDYSEYFGDNVIVYGNHCKVVGKTPIVFGEYCKMFCKDYDYYGRDAKQFIN